MKNILKEKLCADEVVSCEDHDYIPYYNLPNISTKNRSVPLTRAERRALERKFNKKKK